MGGGAEKRHNTRSGAAEGVNKKITLDELAKHREMDNAWVTMRGKVYDISGWEDHPGRLLKRIQLHRLGNENA
jgi:cytochrome b involved in lipid metabolism